MKKDIEENKEEVKVNKSNLKKMALVAAVTGAGMFIVGRNMGIREGYHMGRVIGYTNAVSDITGVFKSVSKQVD